ncbi:MAG: hypothetical protein QM791_01090 [Ferruginibacter sp.]
MKKFTNITISLVVMALLLMSVVGKAQTQTLTDTAVAANKVAILPIAYVGDGNQVRMDEMRYRLQNIAFLYLKDKAVELQFQDLAETNALLLKSGVKESNIREFTPKELAAILGVEYILTGMVTQEVNGVYKFRNHDRDIVSSDRDRSQSKTVPDMQTQVDLAVYNSRGEALYSKSRQSILSDVDAYENGIHYLLKRSPLYKK